MKKENDNLAIISDSEITLLNELVNTLIDLANEDAEKALQQMLYLVENRSFSKQKRLYADVMNKIGEFHGRNGRIEQATEVYNRMLEYVRQGKMKKMEFIALSNLSLCKAYSGKYLEAIETWKLLLIKNIDAEERFHLLNNISAAYGYIGENSLALKYAFAALHIAETHNLEEFKISPLINIGTAFERDLMHQKALDYWLVALDLAKRANSLQNTFNILSNISLAYNALGNKELALQYAFESLELRRKSAFQKEVAAPLNNIGYIYETNGDPDAALEYYEKALKVYRQSTDTMAMANCMANFGSIYQMKG
ncbi:MAG: tetratricopeptide repeat protein, partial [Candidatus Cloacimonetes bacterium]|nr:tetratricopeptide repeat protein [Candidatus Cloacimonadota bacterium]